MALAALRKCLVCEWQGLVVEAENTDEIGPPCQACGAPTERVASTPVDRSAPAANEHAAALGRLGGLKGGPARAAALSARRRREIATLAARTRWNRKRR